MVCTVFFRHILQHLYLLIPVVAFHCIICHILIQKLKKRQTEWVVSVLVSSYHSHFLQSYSFDKQERLNFSFSETLFDLMTKNFCHLGGHISFYYVVLTDVHFTASKDVPSQSFAQLKIRVFAVI